MTTDVVVPAAEPASGPVSRRLDGRRAVVTGAARGMGRAHAEALVRAGASVALVDLDAAELQDAVVRLKGLVGDVEGYRVDITDRAAAESLVDDVVTRFGGLDVLVHNAGLMFSMTGLARTGDDEVAAMLGVNVWAPLYLTRAALPHLMASPAARVIFISSQWGQVPAGHSYGYMVSKAAQLGLMKTLATELAPHRILVNAITPGAVRTRMVPEQNYADEVAAVPIGRLAEPHEIAEVVAFLAADTGGFITGQTIPVNGGALLVGV